MAKMNLKRMQKMKNLIVKMKNLVQDQTQMKNKKMVIKKLAKKMKMKMKILIVIILIHMEMKVMIVMLQRKKRRSKRKIMKAKQNIKMNF
jgi:hypothetical protein